MYLPKPAVSEIPVSPDQALHLREWFAALYAGTATPAQLIAAMDREICEVAA